MPNKRDRDLFVVSDKRKFTAEGELRDDAPSVATQEPPTETAPAEEPKAKLEKIAEPSPEETAAKEREMPPPPTAAEQSEQHANYKEAGKQVDDLLREHGAPANSYREMSFEQLIMSLYMTAMMQLGAVRQEGQQPTPPDILGARQTIDTLGILQEKSKGNVTDREKELLDHSIFELRMTYVEVIRVLSTLPPP